MVFSYTRWIVILTPPRSYCYQKYIILKYINLGGWIAFEVSTSMRAESKSSQAGTRREFTGWRGGVRGVRNIYPSVPLRNSNPGRRNNHFTSIGYSMSTRTWIFQGNGFHIKRFLFYFVNIDSQTLRGQVLV